jgi:ribulose-5-phosphate 4-epimerase/fuculose-1-phosphate aldolase
VSQVSLAHSPRQELSGLMLVGRPGDGRLGWFADGLVRVLRENGHLMLPEGAGTPRLVINFTAAGAPRPYRRRAQGTFVVTVVEVTEPPDDILKAAYPILVRSLSNLLIYALRRSERDWCTYFVTLEQGYFPIDPRQGTEEEYFQHVYRRLAPLANSQLVVGNRFNRNLPPELWQGNARTRTLQWAGRQLAQMNLLPAPFPIQELLPPRDMAHVRRLFGLGGLSYGNLSVRENADSFWMTASGVNKGDLQTVGRDLLLITGYNPAERAMLIAVPPDVEPRRASVDAIEHWMIYTEHPSVGAVIHVHAWMEGVVSTMVNYPCGTAELAREVAVLVRQAPDPSRAVIGLKNHGLTITGHSMADIFERIDGRLLPTVPMT